MSPSSPRASWAASWVRCENGTVRCAICNVELTRFDDMILLERRAVHFSCWLESVSKSDEGFRSD